jgi:hypothetical protein
MGKLKTYTLRLITKGTYTGSVRAPSVDEAFARARNSWSNEDPHPFEQIDEELEYVITEEEVLL